jgi:hypothetical protein
LIYLLLGFGEYSRDFSAVPLLLHDLRFPHAWDGTEENPGFRVGLAEGGGKESTEKRKQ